MDEQLPTLTHRESQITNLLAIGAQMRDIASQLGISQKTVDTHRGHVLKKLRLRNNVELARHALRKGWVPL